jgi:hypothetical protein
MIQPIEHRCLPRPQGRCLTCGEPIPPPSYCGVCGESILTPHVCRPQPIPHTCGGRVASRRCLACGQPLTEARFCMTCGADITPSHRCSAAPITHVPRPDPVHICPTLELPRCPQCGVLMPAWVFCAHCGVDITPLHVCAPQLLAHVCSPLVTMPQRCSHCGELLPSPQHCTRCGADITPNHTCART